ncbi:hypothetical protein BC941DRAFT_448452 [Chlamydoabsidia padenii]|nr:hypothetical protein BC941DRAFT_448452 [Chlamydoabsidia padenii]
MDSQFAPEEDMDNMIDSYCVTINGFIFCTRHGLEVCDKCPTDNRGANNMIVEETLHEKLSEGEFSSWPGDEREPFSVTHQWTRVSSGKGCKECFDWGEKLYREIHGGRKPRHSRPHHKGKHHRGDHADEALH